MSKTTRYAVVYNYDVLGQYHAFFDTEKEAVEEANHDAVMNGFPVDVYRVEQEKIMEIKP